MQRQRIKTRPAVLLAANLVCFSGSALSILNGNATIDGIPKPQYAVSGTLLQASLVGDKSYYQQLCSGTWIGCQTFMTAAHCVCTNFSTTLGSDYGSCQDHLESADNLRVFLQNGGIYAVASVAMNPAFHFGTQDAAGHYFTGDIAVLTLQKPVVGVPPAKINSTGAIQHDLLATILGFGETGTFAGNLVADAGIKQHGKNVTASCTATSFNNHPITEPDNICWQFDIDLFPFKSQACLGDAGGPLFVNDIVAGVISWSTSNLCQSRNIAQSGQGDTAWGSDVYSSRSFIQNNTVGALDKEGTCRRAVRSYIKSYLTKIHTANRKCMDAVNAGKIGGPCPDPKAHDAILKAQASVRTTSLARSCPAGVLENSDLGGGCAGADTPDKLRDCIIAAGDSAALQMLSAEYAIPLGTIGDKAAAKCQKAIVTAARSFMLASLNTQNGCQLKKDLNRAVACPELTTTKRIERLKASAQKRFARACTDASLATLTSGRAFGGSCMGENTVDGISVCELASHGDAADALVPLALGQSSDFSATACGANSQVGDADTFVSNQDRSWSLPLGMGQFKHTFNLPAGMAVLRVTLNGDEDSGNNDIDLYVKYNATPIPDQQPGHADAYSDNNGVFEAVEINNPQAGEWDVLVVETGSSTGKTYQLTATGIMP